MNTLNLCKSISLLSAAFRNLRVENSTSVAINVIIRNFNPNTTNKFHTSSCRRDLMEFFDDKKNWGETDVKVGRSWKADELRIKSNTDLHKLWYILLKERNMLLTMEHECNEQMEMFPNPERLDKVEESMTNLETVVRERNKAYFLLETGEDGERPGQIVVNPFGIEEYYRYTEHEIPSYLNPKWIKSNPTGYSSRAVRKFLLLYREKQYSEKRKAKNRDRNHVMMLMRRNPNIDVNLLRERYPDVDIDKLIRDDKIRGHYVPKL